MEAFVIAHGYHTDSTVKARIITERIDHATYLVQLNSLLPSIPDHNQAPGNSTATGKQTKYNVTCRWFPPPSTTTTTTPSPRQRTPTPTPTTTGARIKNPYGRHSTPRTNSNSDAEAVRQPVAAVGVNTPTRPHPPLAVHTTRTEARNRVGPAGSPEAPRPGRPMQARAKRGCPRAAGWNHGRSGSGRAGNSGGTAHPQRRGGCARGERPRLGGGGGDYGAPAVSRSNPTPARLLLHM
ncbi:hypothetical protein BD410DRAFT_865856 [Rickenella mellea]|uniref:Uncharacterized protein n=1 Tax=Rickenella mellea TaxID=50990 RepID=A0A4Y7Q3W3_9AGAM|nr:hypothetical protein BD410DRAFT_865856 [Rickenella mellea]